MRISFLLAGLIATSLPSSPLVAARVTQNPSPIGKAVRYGVALAPGDAAPPFTGPDFDGKPVAVVYDGSRATVVGFWSSNIAPCRVQSVALQQLFVQYHDVGLQVLGVAMDTGSLRAAPTAARAFMQELGATYPVIRATPEIESEWRGVTVLPLTFLVGKDGKLVRRYVGADDAIMKGLLDDVAMYLAGRPLGDQVLPEVAPSPQPTASPSGDPPPR